MNELKELQSNLKLILLAFNKMCAIEGLKYSLIGGSLIGAIREKGFLAWDDDADIMMEREEFNKLLKILPPEFEIINVLWIPRLVYKGVNKLEGGDYIDILVFDNAPNSTLKHNIKIFGIRFFQGTLKENIVWSNYSFKGKTLTFVTYMIGKLISKKAKLKAYDWLAQIDNNKHTDFLCSYKDQYRYIHLKYNREWFSEYIYVPFEDISLMSMQGYHEYLSTVFGNYMKLPPIEERIPSHGHIEN